MTEILARVPSVLADAVIDDRENGVIRANRRKFSPTRKSSNWR